MAGHVAGRSRTEALSAVVDLLGRGTGVSVDLFGELVHDPTAADQVVEDYRELVAALAPAQMDA